MFSSKSALDKFLHNMQGLIKYTSNFNAFLKYLSLLSIKRKFNSTFLFCTIACNIFCLFHHKTTLWGRSTFLLTCQGELRTHICGVFCVLCLDLSSDFPHTSVHHGMKSRTAIWFIFQCLKTVRIFTWMNSTPAIINEGLTTAGRELREAFRWPDGCVSLQIPVYMQTFPL